MGPPEVVSLLATESNSSERLADEEIESEGGNYDSTEVDCSKIKLTAI